MTRSYRPGVALALCAGCGGGGGDSATVTNPAPSVTLVAPSNGTPGNAIALSTTASDPDDGVTKVKFFDGTLLGEDTTDSYSWSWTPVTAGLRVAASEGPDNVGAGITAPISTYQARRRSPARLRAGRFLQGLRDRGRRVLSRGRTFPHGYRDQYYFADFISRFVGRIDLANGNAAYSFASLAGQPVDLLVGIDGAIYVLTRSAPTSCRQRASASSSTSTQWRTGVAVPLCRCWMQPMLAETMVAGASSSRFASLRSRSAVASSG